MSDKDYSCVSNFDIMVFCYFGYLCVVLALGRPNPMKQLRNEHFLYYVLEGDLV
jgi:hypothetical protein